MKILVTGATGFIGRHVISRLLGSEHDVFWLRRGGELPVQRMDAALHLAWEGIPDFSARHSLKNLDNSLQLFRKLGEAGCKRVVGVGSCAEYGGGEGKMSELVSVEPERYAAMHSFGNNLGVFKHAAHTLGRQVAREFDMQFIWTRLFYVYGPGQRSGSLIPSLIACVRSGNKLALQRPDTAHDFIHVADVASALVALLEHPSLDRSVYNIGNGTLNTVRYIAQAVYGHFGKPEWALELGFDQQIEISGMYADIARISGDTGWRPQHYLRKGLETMF